MTPDSELLATFARTNSEDAFAELVRRHVNLVYSAALRQVGGDAHLAQDAAQSVFTDLARKAGSLAQRDALSGWLYTSAHFAAAKLVRTETRRRDREEHFMREQTNQSSTGVATAAPTPELEWEQLRPLLDAAMHELKEADRTAIVLRYFENRPFAEVGAQLGLNENAARMRVERALEKLRATLAQRGLATTATLVAVISAQAVQVAPAGLAATLTTASLVSAGAGTFTLLKLMTATNLKLAAGALVVAGVLTAFVFQQQKQDSLQVSNAALLQQTEHQQIENQNLAERLAAMEAASQKTKEQFKELLKLRGEIGLLRNKAESLRQENQILRDRLAAGLGPMTNNSAVVAQIHIKARFVTAPKGALAGGAGLVDFSGVMSSASYKNLLQKMREVNEVNILGEPEVTTTSGRHSQMRATQTITVITKQNLLETNGTSSINFETEPVETGPILDCTPTILPDGHTIALRLTASVIDFLGYTPVTNAPPVYTKNGEPIDLPRTTPEFYTRTNSAEVSLFDDQTFAFKLADAVLPSETRLLTATDAKTEVWQTDTMVFVTATVIDAAGNRTFTPSSEVKREFRVTPSNSKVGGSTNLVPQLYTRQFKLDSETFFNKLNTVFPFQPGESETSRMVRLFDDSGLSLSSGESVFVNTNKILIRATEAKLAEAEHMINALSSH